MKRIGAMFILINLLAIGAEKTTYFVVPEKVDVEKEVTIEGMVSKGSISKISVSEKTSYGVVGKYRMMEATITYSNDDAEVKVAVVYQNPEDDRYVILADNEVLSTTLNQMEGYYDGGTSPENLISTSSYSYDNFPGYIVGEKSRIFSMVIGNEVVEEGKSRAEPSNILAKFGSGDNMAGDGLNINPGEGTNEFMIEDKDGNIKTMGEFKDGSIDTQYEASAKHLRFKVKSNPRTLYINGEAETLKTNQAYDFYNIDRVKVWNTGNGNGHWYLSMSGGNVVTGGSSLIPEGQEEITPENIEVDQFYIKDTDGNFWIADENSMDTKKAKLTKIKVKKSKEEDKDGEDTYTKIEEYSIVETQEYIEQNGKYYFYYGPAEEVFFKIDSNDKYPPKIDGIDYVVVEKEVLYKYKPDNLNKWLILRGEKKGNKFDDDNNGKWHISLVDPQTSSVNPEEVVVVGGKGDILEGSVDLETSYEGKGRGRKSKMKMNLYGEEDGGEVFGVDSISE